MRGNNRYHVSIDGIVIAENWFQRMFEQLPGFNQYVLFQICRIPAKYSPFPSHMNYPKDFCEQIGLPGSNFFVFSIFFVNLGHSDFS